MKASVEKDVGLYVSILWVAKSHVGTSKNVDDEVG